MVERSRIRETRFDRLFGLGNRLLVGALLIVVMYPLVYLGSASVSDPAAVRSGQMWLWPVGFTLEGFARVFRDPDVLIGYRNTLFYTEVGTFINLAVTLPCAYALSRPELPGRRFFVLFILVTMLFSGGLIPTYLLVRDLGLTNTVWALLLPKAASAWHIFVATAFFAAAVPRELQDAAEVDGCTPLRFSPGSPCRSPNPSSQCWRFFTRWATGTAISTRSSTCPTATCFCSSSFCASWWCSSS